VISAVAPNLTFSLKRPVQRSVESAKKRNVGNPFNLNVESREKEGSKLLIGGG
jgi:hypothetical protein